MNKGVIIGGIIILAGAATSTPYFLGNAIEGRFNQAVKDLQVSLPQIESKLGIRQENYQKGWFSSSSRVILSFDGNELPIDNKITHGPFSYFGLGKVESTVVLDNSTDQLQTEIESFLARAMPTTNGLSQNTKTQSPISQLFSGQSPLVVTTQVGFSSSVSINIYSPAVDNKPLPNAPSTFINWGGINGTTIVNGQASDTNITAPKFRLIHDKNLFELQTITLKSNGFYDTNYKQWEKANTSGKASLGIDKLTLSDGISTFSSQLDLAIDSTDDQKDLGFNTKLKLTDLKIPENLGIEVADNSLIEARLSFTNMPKKAFVDYLVKYEALEKQHKANDDQQIQAIVEPFFISYLQGTPSVQAQLLLKDSKKSASLSMDVKLVSTDLDAKTIEQVLTSAQDRLEATLTSNTSESFIDMLVQRGLLPMSMSKADLVQTLVENNGATFTNGELSTKTEYKKGHFYVNGKLNPELERSFPYLLQSFFY